MKPLRIFGERQEKRPRCTYNGETPPHGTSLAIIYRSELDYISRCILDYPNIETGGELFGFWTSKGTPVVVYAIGPGKNARHNYTSFLQDADYPRTVANPIYNMFRLQHVGQWHSHHQLGLAEPSGGDSAAIQRGVRDQNFPRLLLCIGNCDGSCTTINPFNYYDGCANGFDRACWDVIDSDSPYRPLIDKALNHVLIHPFTPKASHGFINSIQNRVQNIPQEKLHWLMRSVENVETMKSFIATLQDMIPTAKIETEMQDNGEPSINITNMSYEIILPFGFPLNAPLLRHKNGFGKLDNPDTEQVLEMASKNWQTSDIPLTQDFALWLQTVMPVMVKEPELAGKVDEK